MTSSLNSDSKRIILDYIDKFGVRDKDAAVSPGRKKKTFAVGKAKRGSVRATIDLHGMTTGPALAALRDAIDDCVQRGVAELLVIHGYGLHSAPGEGGVLKVAVRQYLEAGNDPRIRSSTTAKPKDGGEGATVVRLK